MLSRKTLRQASREAAKECSPQRKLWGGRQRDQPAPEGRKNPWNDPACLQNPQPTDVQI